MTEQEKRIAMKAQELLIFVNRYKWMITPEAMATLIEQLDGDVDQAMKMVEIHAKIMEKFNKH